MEHSVVKLIYNLLENLIDAYGFEIKTELNEGQSFMIEYSSKKFVIKIEKYFREFYVSLYKFGKPDSEINLFNLLEYLKQGDSNIPKSEYFGNEKDIEKSYMKQLTYVSSLIYDNYDVINIFFGDDRYEANVVEFERFWRSKHPEFYQKI